jgi:multicomponent Na+:H+ antiporter subunit D
MPFTMLAFLVGSLSIIGLPLTGGMWSKWYLGLGTLDKGHYVVLAALMVSSLLNIAYLLPIPIRAFLSAPEDDEAGPGGMREAPWPCVAALLLTATGCIFLFFYPDPFYQLLSLMFAGPG